MNGERICGTRAGTNGTAGLPPSKAARVEIPMG